MRQSIGLIALGGFFLLMQSMLWSAQGGVIQYWQLKKNIAQQLVENQQWEKRNTMLHAEVLDLKQGFAAIEERARAELGMIKSHEQFYQIVSEHES